MHTLAERYEEERSAVLSQYQFCPCCGSRLINGVFEGAVKQHCESACGFVHWNNPTPVVLALVEFNGLYVVTHNVEWPEWKYSLISGFLDTQEDPEQAVIREVEEELALKAIETTLITTSIYEPLNQLMLAYHVMAEGEIKLNHEHDAYKLLDDEALSQWPFGLGATPAIQQWLGRAGIAH